jgi:DNA-binding LacI/PurR family transcriptional regulator
MVTIKDIAVELGISHSVVSRALNPTPDVNARVSDETRELVERKASELGYRRNRTAEFMRRGRSATIGVFLPKYSNSLIADLVMGVSESANKHGFPISFNFGMTYKSYENFISSNIENPSSGIISYPSQIYSDKKIETLFQSYVSSGGKALLLNTSPKKTVPVLYMDDSYGAKLAADKLLSKKCTKYFILESFESRSTPFFARLADKGAECHSLNLNSFPQLLSKLDASDYPIGVFAVTDDIAVSLMRMLRSANITIGSDAYLVGYDDLNLTASLDPPLTTVRQPFKEQGVRAIEKLLNMIYGGVEKDEALPPRLVERETA